MISLLDYTISEEIYSSINTIVYRGYRNQDRHPLIFKYLRVEYPNPSQLTKFKHQYEITKNINLPGVVKPYGLESYQNSLVLILEDIGGQSLKQFIASVSLELEQFLRIAIKLADIIGYLHHHKIIHKDIKPDNIIINPETQQIQIIDFSISSQLSSEQQSISNPNLLEGTLAYMSPEQTGRMNRSIDYRSDFYSLGVTFYELLTGRLPFTATDALELVHCHIAKQPIPINAQALNSEIPQVISDIVMKLMAKTAEERYQSGFGLKADLENCLNQLVNAGKIEPFPLGERDLSGQLIISQKLYGREAEVTKLMDTFREVMKGKTEMILVAGYSGIGKSALVHEIHKPIVQQKGYFIDGKFDQFKRNIPYTSLIQAFQELTRQLLTETEQKLQVWKEKILTALEGKGQVIIEVIPELELILGSQPAVPELGPSESQNRFNLVFQNFIRVFTSKEHPLVLFLDDLQWADAASLKLIELLMTDSESQYLLLIGAYRDNEVNAAHPLMLTLEEIHESGAMVNTITLKPLEFADVNQLITDSIKCDLICSQSLAQLCLKKTNGNPFFLTQLIKSLYQENLLFFAFESGCWQWDVAQIEKMGITDNVVELMVGKIQKLQLSTQNVLKLAACIGNRFNLEVLAIVNEKSSSATAVELWSALQTGLILPLSDAYKIPIVLEQEYGASQVPIAYKFLHDRVQQAAYALIGDEHKQEIHLKVGQLLLKNTPVGYRSEKLFDIVNHLNIGSSLITEEIAKYELAELNLLAGQKAKLSNAFDSALKYIGLGVELLTDDSWSSHYQLAFELHLEQAICLHLTGEIVTAENLFTTIVEKAQNNIDRANVYAEMESLYLSLGRHQDVIDTVVRSLRDLGIEVPDPADGEALVEAAKQLRAEAFAIIGDRQIAELIDWQEMTDEASIAAFKHLGNLAPSSFFLNMNLYLWLGAMNLHLSVTQGNCILSSFGYSVCGLSTLIQGDLNLAYELAKLGVEVSEKYNAVPMKGACYFHFCLINSWKHHFKIDAEYAKRGFQYAMDAGDYFFISWSAHARVRALTLMGAPLEKICAQVDKYIGVVKKANYENAAFLIAPQRFALTLQGKTKSKDDFSDENFAEEAFVQETTAYQNKAPIGNYYIYKIQCLYLFGEYNRAYSLTSEAINYVSEQWIEATEYHFYYALVIAGLYDRATPDEQNTYRAILEQQLTKLKAWADAGQENFLHRYLILAGEVARIEGRDIEAIDLYDSAIASAKEHQFIQNEALANELVAKFWLAKGKEKLAKVYLQEAQYNYQRWGATLKVAELEQQYSQLLLTSTQRRGELTATVSTSRTSTSSSTSNGSSALDLTTVIKASQTIGSEIVLEQLLCKLMKILIENAGAQTGFLLLESKGQLLIEAEGTVENDHVNVLQSIPISNRLPTSLINYVSRTRETIVLQDATREGNFIKDPSIQQHQPKSILCFPLIDRGKLTGILYLENNLTTGAFTPDRLEVLKILSTQAAISIENARLYAEVTESERRLTQFLEAMPIGVSVHEPTGQLYYANQAAQELMGINAFPQAETEQLSQAYQVYRAGTNQLYPTDQLPMVRSLNGERVHADDLELHQPDKIIPVEISTTPIFDETGKLVYAIAAFQDITQRKQAEKLIAQYNRTLEEQVKERTAQLALANQEIMALNERLKAENLRMSAELEVTKQLQQMVLPKREELESIEGLEIAGFMEPADEVGGDYYDVLQQHGRTKITIGDVTGHGLESGVVMLMAQTAVRTLQESNQTDSVQFLDILNRTLYRNVQRINPYKNLTLSVLDYSDGCLSVSGQHEEIIVVRASGQVERIDTRDLGFPLGLDEEIADFIASQQVQLNSGDVVVLYTDGITEAFDIERKQYGIERLCDMVARNCDRTVQEIRQAVIEDLRRHIGEQKVFDDITLLVLKQK